MRKYFPLFLCLIYVGLVGKGFSLFLPDLAQCSEGFKYSGIGLLLIGFLSAFPLAEFGDFLIKSICKTQQSKLKNPNILNPQPKFKVADFFTSFDYHKPNEERLAFEFVDRKYLPFCNSFLSEQYGELSPSTFLFVYHLLFPISYPYNNDNTIETNREDLRDKSILFLAKLKVVEKHEL